MKKNSLKTSIYIILLLSIIGCSTNNYYYHPTPKDKDKDYQHPPYLVFVKTEVPKYGNIYEICSRINSSIAVSLNAPTVFLCNPDGNFDMEKLSQQYPYRVFIDIKFKRDYNTTVILDILSVGTLIPYIPSPHWGNYTLKATVNMSSPERVFNKNFTIVSDFSYILYSAFRDDTEKASIRRATSHFVNRVVAEKGFRSVVENRDIELEEENFLSGIVPEETDYYTELEEESFRVVQRNNIETKFMVAEFRYQRGITNVTGYYSDENGSSVGASGWGDVVEFKIQGSSFQPRSYVYFSPNFGSYYQKNTLKDFGYDVSELNKGREGYIPGKSSDPTPDCEENGTCVDYSDKLESLEYEIEYYSFFGGVIAGFNLLVGSDFQWFFTPSVSINMAEVRYSVVHSTTKDYTSLTFPFFSSFGVNFATGFFIPKIRSGMKVGFNYSYFRDFEFDKKIEFKEVYKEDSLYKSHRIFVDRVQIQSFTGYVDLFIFF
ncbi:hypothetical protein JXR93_13895 [bacterium]|nr:hypothetical protein [bacterium]